MQIDPNFIFNFESNLTAKYSNAWKRTLAGLWFSRLTLTQTSSSLVELYQWMLETAQIRPTGKGGTSLTFEDLVSIAHKLENEDFGNGLKLNRNKIEDNRIDHAAKWAADTGSAAAYWPQRQVVELIKQGETAKAYDGKAFFATDHPVNPFDSLSGSYANLFVGTSTDKLELNAANVAKIVGKIQTLKQPGDAPRNLTPSILVVPTMLRYPAVQLTSAEFFTDPKVSGGAAASNIIKTEYGFQVPIIAHELENDSTKPDFSDWYIGCEADEDAFDGAFVYQERKAFEMTSYTGMTQADLDRINEFEWHNRGRNVAGYGHPYLFFKVKPYKS